MGGGGGGVLGVRHLIPTFFIMAAVIYCRKKENIMARNSLQWPKIGRRNYLYINSADLAYPDLDRSLYPGWCTLISILLAHLLWFIKGQLCIFVQFIKI
jgi:hypothetical protein